MNTADKLREYLRGERDWEQRDMARECLAEIEALVASFESLYANNRGA